MFSGNFTLRASHLSSTDLGVAFDEVAKWALPAAESAPGVHFFRSDRFMYDLSTSTLGFLERPSSGDPYWVLFHTVADKVNVMYEMMDSTEDDLREWLQYVARWSTSSDPLVSIMSMTKTMSSEVFDGMSQAELALVLGDYLSLSLIAGCACEEEFPEVQYRVKCESELHRTLFRFLSRVFNRECILTSKRGKIVLPEHQKFVFQTVFSTSCQILDSYIKKVSTYHSSLKGREVVLAKSIYAQYLYDFRKSYCDGMLDCSIATSAIRFLSDNEIKALVAPLKISSEDASEMEAATAKALSVAQA